MSKCCYYDENKVCKTSKVCKDLLTCQAHSKHVKHTVNIQEVRVILVGRLQRKEFYPALNSLGLSLVIAHSVFFSLF